VKQLSEDEIGTLEWLESDKENLSWQAEWGVRVKKGDAVKFLGEGGFEIQLEKALRFLKPDEIYTLSGIYADKWGVSFYLDGVEDKSFPEDMFEVI